MKIAVMMRVTDQDTGLGFFTDVLVRTPLQMDRMNSYLLLYKEPKHCGRFANFANVNCLALGIYLGGGCPSVVSDCTPTNWAIRLGDI